MAVTARSCLIAAGLLVGSAAMAGSDGPGLYLFRIPSGSDAAQAVAAADRVQVDLHVRRPAQLEQQLAATSLEVIAVEEGLVRVIAGLHETLSGDPLPAHRAASFVIDFDEASVASLLETLRHDRGDQPSIAELVEFVDSNIARKSHRRSFDFASQVATSREGDCTEHAVLLAALARATDRPARVVLGIMLVELPTQLLAFGHAWTEIHDGHGWQIADATRPEKQLPDARARYLPLVELANEGPGYAVQMLDLVVTYPEQIDRVPLVEDREARVR